MSVQSYTRTVYLHFMFSTFYLLKSLNVADPKFRASMLSGLLMTLLSLNVFFIRKAFGDLSNAWIMATLLIVILIDKPLEKVFDKAISRKKSDFSRFEERGKLNGVVVVLYFLAAFVLLMMTIGITQRFW